MAHPPNPTDDTFRVEPSDQALDEAGEEVHQVSLTGAAAEALRIGLLPMALPEEEMPGQDRILQAGDPDVDPIDVAFSGEIAPGGGNSSPDQNNVDEIGRLYGVSQPDGGPLQLGDDLIAPRDQKRWELDPASKEDEP